MRRHRRGDGATTAVVGFAVTLLIFTMSLGAFLTVLQAPAHGTRDAPVLGAEADQGIVDLVATTGYRVSGAVRAKAWEGDPDKTTRLGLAAEGTAGALDAAKLRNATRGGVAAEANGWLDYQEARAALKTGGADFHLRTYPVWAPLAQAGATPLVMNVCYVGDFTAVPGAPPSNFPVQNASALLNAVSHVFLNVTVTNNGTTATKFRVQYSFSLKDGDFEDTANVPMLAPGESRNVSLKLHKSLLWQWKDITDQNVHIKIRDPVKKVGDFKVDLTPAAMNTGAALGRIAVTVNADKLVFTTAERPKVTWQGWQPDGESEGLPAVNLEVRDSAGAVVATWSGTSDNWEAPAPWAAGWYNVSLALASDPSFTANETLVVLDGAQNEFLSAVPTTLTESDVSKAERHLLVELAKGFRNTTYNVSSGHVYMDLAGTLPAALAANLTTANYRVLLVGSGADHAALNDPALTTAVREFVRGGGLVLALGSAAQGQAWLAPTYAGSMGSTKGYAAFDPTHPIVNFPQKLDLARFLDGGRYWRLAVPGDGGHFTHVLGKEVGGPALLDDVLAVSRPGHFGDGSVVLTAWQLGALTQPQDRTAALAALHNLLGYAAGAAYVELGPPVPRGAEVEAASRMSTLAHPWIAGDRLFVRVELRVFR